MRALPPPPPTHPHPPPPRPPGCLGSPCRPFSCFPAGGARGSFSLSAPVELGQEGFSRSRCCGGTGDPASPRGCVGHWVSEPLRTPGFLCRPCGLSLRHPHRVEGRRDCGGPGQHQDGKGPSTGPTLNGEASSRPPAQSRGFCKAPGTEDHGPTPPTRPSPPPMALPSCSCLG